MAKTSKVVRAPKTSIEQRRVECTRRGGRWFGNYPDRPINNFPFLGINQLELQYIGRRPYSPFGNPINVNLAFGQNHLVFQPPWGDALSFTHKFSFFSGPKAQQFA